MSIITSSNAIMERGEEKRSSPPISTASSFTINQSTAADLEQHQRNLIVLMDMALRDKRESLFGEHGNKSCREEIKFPVHAHHGGQGGEETNTGEMTSPVRPPRQKLSCRGFSSFSPHFAGTYCSPPSRSVQVPHILEYLHHHHHRNDEQQSPHQEADRNCSYWSRNNEAATIAQLLEDPDEGFVLCGPGDEPVCLPLRPRNNE